jgi:hypothetical protein
VRGVDVTVEGSAALPTHVGRFLAATASAQLLRVQSVTLRGVHAADGGAGAALRPLVERLPALQTLVFDGGNGLAHTGHLRLAATGLVGEAAARRLQRVNICGDASNAVAASPMLQRCARMLFPAAVVEVTPPRPHSVAPPPTARTAADREIGAAAQQLRATADDVVARVTAVDAAIDAFVARAVEAACRRELMARAQTAVVLEQLR